jgi:sugar phosphate isomerase/epimerase
MLFAMIRNTNDGTRNAPRMRLDINGSNVFGLPSYSSVPKGDSRAVLEAVKAAGFEGIQTGSKAQIAREVGLRVTGSGRINAPEDADARAQEAKSAGCDCYTVHVGWGIEDDDLAWRLVEATLRASEKHDIPLYIETHRATITDDIWRTVQLVRKFPEICFNGDFSHWYAGHEMVYGDIQAKWQFMQPVFERVRFIHARIANPGCIQVDIGDGTNQTYVDHFRVMWTRSFAGFLKSAGPGDIICFTPELLGADVYYARNVRNASGELVEESDRWQQALLLGHIGRQCWDDALAGATP